MRRYDEWFATIRQQMGQRYGEPVEAMVLVHKAGEKPVGTMHGRFRVNNLLCLTPTALRINALAGRSGMKPGKDVAVWARDQVAIAATDTEKAAWFNTTMSWMEWEVHRLQIWGPALAVTVDVMRANAYADPAPDLRRLLEACGARPEEVR